MAANKKLELGTEAHRRKILLTAANMFIQQGYTATTLRALAKEANVNIGSLMHLFDNKENILCALVNVVLDSQFKVVEKRLKNTTNDPCLLWAAETTLQQYIAERNEHIRDLYVTAYSLPNSSDLIRRHITEKMAAYFQPFNPEYQEKDFYELEIAASGITRSFMSIPCDMYFTMDAKIARYLETTFRVHGIPPEKTQEAIQFVSQFDFAQIAQELVDSILTNLAKEI